MATVTINGTDPETLGYNIFELSGWGAAMKTNYPSAAIPGRASQVSSIGTVEPRVIKLGIIVSAATVSARDAALDTLLALFTGSLTLVFGDSPTKAITGKLTNVESQGIAQQSNFIIPDLKVMLEITCHDPAKYDVTPVTATMTSVAVTVGVGTIACGGIFTITGATNPTLTYATASGTAIATMGFTASVTTITVNTINMTVQQTVAGVTTSNIDLWTSGDFFWIDPAYPGGTLKVSSGTAVFTYSRRWMS